MTTSFFSVPSVCMVGQRFGCRQSLSTSANPFESRPMTSVTWFHLLAKCCWKTSEAGAIDSIRIGPMSGLPIRAGRRIGWSSRDPGWCCELLIINKRRCPVPGKSCARVGGLDHGSLPKSLGIFRNRKTGGTSSRGAGGNRKKDPLD